MEEIKITLETLYDILRNEKQRADLQQLNDSFFIDIVSYLKEKKILLDSKQNEDDLFAAGEREKLEYELKSIKRILKEVYEKREKKIIDIAMNKSRTGSNIIDIGAMLKEEKEFYRLILGLLDGYRKGVLMKLFNGELPLVELSQVDVGKINQVKIGQVENDKIGIKIAETKENLEEQKEKIITSQILEEEKEVIELEEKKEIKPISSGSVLKEEIKESVTSTFMGELRKEEPKEQKDETGESTINPVAESTKTEPKPVMKKIKFIHPLPSFVWTDLKDYGPFEAGEEIDLFTEVAELIIEKGRAVEV